MTTLTVDQEIDIIKEHLFSNSFHRLSELRGLYSNESVEDCDVDTIRSLILVHELRYNDYTFFEELKEKYPKEVEVIKRKIFLAHMDYYGFIKYITKIWEEGDSDLRTLFELVDHTLPILNYVIVSEKGGEGEGEYAEKVFYSLLTGRYYKITGEYYSYDGYYWDDDSCKQVFPKQETIIVYK